MGLEAAALDATVTGITSDVREQQIGIWRNQIEQRLIDAGMSPTDAAIEASITKATFTGLTLDLVASGDQIRLTTALETALLRLEDRLSEARRG